ncbi:hypothetical protein RB195_018487 [Necator americanus]|uniref:Reverse transcriptase domain-containing protein n=1 Tax=Necator americanus TaxID=51031 RepID=A0ABR1CA08_NECAM
MLLCLTFIDLKKTFDSVEAEAVMEALDSVTRQCETFSPKTFTGTLEYAMRKLEWDDMGVDVWQLHRADDIVLMTTSISQAEQMLTEFDETCGCIGLQLNLQKTMFICLDGSRMPHHRSTERTYASAQATFIWAEKLT